METFERDAVSSSSASKIATDGVLFIQGYKPGAASFDAISDFGKIEVVEGLNPIQTLVPRGLGEATPNTYSGNFGVGVFPLHTDLAHWATPPRYLALRCIWGVNSVGTRLLDSRCLIDRFGADALRGILVQPRRPMRNGKHLLPLLERTSSSSQFRIRWDSIYLRPASTRSAEIFAQVLKFIETSEPSEIILKNRGDMLIIDNWRYLHGRARVDEEAANRHLDRAYLESLF